MGDANSAGRVQTVEDRTRDLPRPACAPVFAVLGAVSLATAPVARYSLGLAAGTPTAEHTGHVGVEYLFDRTSHRLAFNGWAYQNSMRDFLAWGLRFAAVAALWLVIALWLRSRNRRGGADSAGGADSGGGARSAGSAWRAVLVTACGVELAAGLLALGAGAFASAHASALDPLLVRLMDAASPWLAVPAALILLAARERNRAALAAAAAYGVLLAVFLVVRVPWPAADLVEGLVLSAVLLVPAVRVSAGDAAG